MGKDPLRIAVDLYEEKPNEDLQRIIEQVTESRIDSYILLGDDQLLKDIRSHFVNEATKEKLAEKLKEEVEKWRETKDESLFHSICVIGDFHNQADNVEN
jgi:vacuolar-type H+-ATPase subunit F/Vma7